MSAHKVFPIVTAEMSSPVREPYFSVSYVLRSSIALIAFKCIFALTTMIVLLAFNLFDVRTNKEREVLHS